VFRLASFHHQVFLKLHLELCSLNTLSAIFGTSLQNENMNFVLENKMNTLLEKEESIVEEWRGRKGVKMGTRAITSESLGTPRQRPSSSQASLSSIEAYVIDTEPCTFSLDLHESLPSALLGKLRDLSCESERILKKVS